MARPPQKLYLTRRNNGIYYAGSFSAGKKRWKSTGCRSKSDAYKSLQDLATILRERTPEKTFDQFADEFFKYAESTFARKTVIIYRTTLRHIKALCGNPACVVSDLPGVKWGRN